MRPIVFVFLISLYPFSALAANNACSDKAFQEFDFWLGQWQLSWNTPSGETKTGTNTIEKILGGCVIQESFTDGSFSGNSVSTYNKATQQWQQTWVDNQGSYLVFNGRFENDTMRLSMAPQTNQEGKTIIRRMQFKEIKTNSLTWYWQSSEDNGENWQDLWVIKYQRKL